MAPLEPEQHHGFYKPLSGVRDKRTYAVGVVAGVQPGQGSENLARRFGRQNTSLNMIANPNESNLSGVIPENMMVLDFLVAKEALERIGLPTPSVDAMANEYLSGLNATHPKEWVDSLRWMYENGRVRDYRTSVEQSCAITGSSQLSRAPISDASFDDQIGSVIFEAKQFLHPYDQNRARGFSSWKPVESK